MTTSQTQDVPVHGALGHGVIGQVATLVEQHEDGTWSLALTQSINGVQQVQAIEAMSVPVDLFVGTSVVALPVQAQNEVQWLILAPIGRQASCSITAKDVAIQAGRLQLSGDRLELNARRLFEKTVDAYRWTKGLVQSVCGRKRTLVDEQLQIQAGRIDQRAKGAVRIDGEHINLG